MKVEPDEFQVVTDPGSDRTVYTDLVHRHLRRVFAICLSLLGEPADAEDAVHRRPDAGVEVDVVAGGGKVLAADLPAGCA